MKKIKIDCSMITRDPAEASKASKELDYEKAAIARDRIKALTQIQTSQKINQTNLNEADVISIYKETGKTCIQVFFFRSKQNWGNQAFYPKHDPEDTIKDILSSFISQFYENKTIPVIIITNDEVNEKNLLEKTFSKKEGKGVVIKLAKSKKYGAIATGNINKAYISIFNFVFRVPAITGNIGIFANL